LPKDGVLHTPNLAAARAGDAGDRLRPRLGATPFARCASLEPRDADLALRAEDRFLEVD
jgi:hypothetical protein